MNPRPPNRRLRLPCRLLALLLMLPILLEAGSLACSRLMLRAAQASSPVERETETDESADEKDADPSPASRCESRCRLPGLTASGSLAVLNPLPRPVRPRAPRRGALPGTPTCLVPLRC